MTLRVSLEYQRKYSKDRHSDTHLSQHPGARGRRIMSSESRLHNEFETILDSKYDPLSNNKQTRRWGIEEGKREEGRE